VTNAYFVETINKNLEKILECEIKTNAHKNTKNNNTKNIFPGSQPVAIEKKNLETLKKNKYVVCEKSDGERYILIILKEYTILVNRNNEFFNVNINIDQEILGQGSIFDGEMLINNKGEKVYLIHDCMAYNGTNFIKKSHNLRYGAIIDFLTKRYFPDNNNDLLIKTKIFYHYTTELEKTWEHIQSTSENKIDGLIFTPIYHQIEFGRQLNLFKWKNGGNHTIDLLVKIINNKIHTYYSNNKIFKKINNTDDEYTKIIKFTTKEALLKGIIIEFNYIQENLIPYRIRNDKILPNSKLTVDNTLKNIKESLEIQDLS
jgi:ATP-dependent DNA ligase